MKVVDSVDFFPYLKFGWFRNPFGELDRFERAQLAVVPKDFWPPHFNQTGVLTELVGGCGRGKSTHLHVLASRFPMASYVYVPRGVGGRITIPDGELILIDEAQRLSHSGWKAVLSSNRPVVVGTHRSRANWIRKQGWKVHRIRVASTTNSRKVFESMRRRIEASMIANPMDPTTPNDTAQDGRDSLHFFHRGGFRWDPVRAQSLWARFGNQLRNIEQFLYQEVEQQRCRSAMSH